MSFGRCFFPSPAPVSDSDAIVLVFGRLRASLDAVVEAGRFLGIFESEPSEDVSQRSEDVVRRPYK